MALTIVAVVAVGAVIAVGAGRGDPAPDRQEPTSGARVPGRPAPPAYREWPHPTAREKRWISVVSALDAARERAWREGRPASLRTVYVEGSMLLGRDQHMMRRYAERGLRVAGVSLQLRSVRLVARRPGVVRLMMVDELGRLVARARGTAPMALPDDQPSRHLLELRQERGRWQIAAAWSQ